MADEADIAGEIDARALARGLAAACRAAAIPVGTPGECAWCGEPSPRLVGGRCAPCRDGRR